TSASDAICLNHLSTAWKLVCVPTWCLPPWNRCRGPPMPQGVVKQFGPIGNGYGTAQPPSGTGEIHCQQVVWPLAHKRDDGAPSRGVWSKQDYAQRGWPKYGCARALTSARQACIRSIYHRA